MSFCGRNAVESQAVNCAVECVNGCILGEQCPHREHLAATTQFMQEKSMDQILAIAEERIRKKFAESARPLPDLPHFDS
jgi:hypothetical protein